MRKLLFIISILLWTTSYSQFYSDAKYDVELSTGQCHTLEINSYLYDNLDNYFFEASENNVNIDVIQKLKGIYLCHFDISLPTYMQNNFGLTLDLKTGERVILVNVSLIPFYLPTFLDAVVYHELYHHLLDTGDHVKNTPYVLRDGEFNNPEVLIKTWNSDSKEEYFNYIKQQQENKESVTVTATVYHAVPEQTNSDPGHTASMFSLDLSNPYKHRIIAVSRDLRKKFPYGTLVKVSGTTYDGIYRVEDTMNERFTNCIDILINLDMKIGKWYNAKIQKL